MITKYVVWAAGVGWGAVAVLTWLWLDARDDRARAIAECNQRVLESVADAERVIRQTIQENAAEQVRQARRMAETAARRMREAEAAREKAEARPPIVRQIIKEVAVNEPCLDQPVPAAVIDGLRDNQDR